MNSLRRRFLAVLSTMSAVALAIAVVQVNSATSVRAATFSVTSLADDGSTGTLRWAITQANATAGADTITFGGSVIGTIALTSNLPSVTETLTITGPGQDDLTIDGVGLYRPFTFTFGGNSGQVLTLSGMTLRRGGGGNEAQLIFNSRGTVNASNMIFEDTTGTAVFNKEAWSVATYTNCLFRRNGKGIAGDHGSTPSAVSNVDTDYQNRTYVVNSRFENNSAGIFNYRFTKVTNSTFSNNGYGAYVTGLNRTQIFNSTFTGNTTAVLHDAWTPTTWTTIGTNNRLHDGNTYTNNGTVFYLTDGWNNGQKSQQWTTITNNTWDGNGTWIEATRWNGSANVSDVVTTVNSANRVWIESGNVVVAPTTTTTTTTTTSTTTSTTSTTTTIPSSTPTTVSSTTVVSATTVPTSGSQNDVTTNNSGNNQDDETSPNVAAPASSTTTTSTTTTIPAPEVPEASPGEGVVMIDGVATTATVTRANNQIIIGAGSINVTFTGRTSSGEIIPLDADGNMRVVGNDIVSIEGFGFLPDSDIEVWMFSTPRLITTVSSDSLGRVNDDVVLPAAIEEGSHRFVLNGQTASGDDAVVGLGLIVGYEAGGLSTTGKFLIALPIALAILAGLLIPTALRRRRKDDDNSDATFVTA